jgi:hypothetical protein
MKKAEPLQVEQKRKRCPELRSLPPEETVGAMASNTEDRYDVATGDSAEKAKWSRAFSLAIGQAREKPDIHLLEKQWVAPVQELLLTQEPEIHELK